MALVEGKGTRNKLLQERNRICTINLRVIAWQAMLGRHEFMDGWYGLSIVWPTVDGHLYTITLLGQSMIIINKKKWHSTEKITWPTWGREWQIRRSSYCIHGHMSKQQTFWQKASHEANFSKSSPTWEYGIFVHQCQGESRYLYFSYRFIGTHVISFSYAWLFCNYWAWIVIL